VTKVFVDALKKPIFSFPGKADENKVKEPDENKKEYALWIPEGTLDPGVSGRVIQFYAHVTELAQLMDEHVAAAKIDDATIASGMAGEDSAFTTQPGQKMLKYFVLLYNPSDADKAGGKGLNLGDTGGIGANIVEVGPMMCDEHTYAKDGQCATGAPGLGFRTVPNTPGQDATWSRAEVLMRAPSPGGAFPNSQLIPLIHTPVLDTLLKGAQPSTSELDYQARLKRIHDMTAQLVTEGDDLGKKLANAANTGTRFSFFM
jgi:hypothetical protein